MSDTVPSSEPTPGVRTRRRHNFSDREVEILVTEVIKHFHSGGRRLTAVDKANKWEEITRKMNAYAPCQRLAREVQKRWADYKQRLKKKMASARRHAEETGGGLPQELHLTALEERASVAISAVELVGVGLIDTGCDTPLTWALSPLERETDEGPHAEKGAEAMAEIGVPARDVDATQMEASRLLRLQSLAHIRQHYESVTEAQETHLTSISNTLTRMEHQFDNQLTTLNNTLSNFGTQMSSVNTTLASIASLLQQIYNDHSTRPPPSVTTSPIPHYSTTASFSPTDHQLPHEISELPNSPSPAPSVAAAPAHAHDYAHDYHSYYPHDYHPYYPDDYHPRHPTYYPHRGPPYYPLGYPPGPSSHPRSQPADQESLEASSEPSTSRVTRNQARLEATQRGSRRGSKRKKK
ncbi:uncharacterized protein LOC142099176 isoform X2 [Mixophyes fleayi]